MTSTIFLDDKNGRHLHRKLKELLIRGRDLGLQRLQLDYISVRIVDHNL